jgi:hypothetical protein
MYRSWHAEPSISGSISCHHSYFVHVSRVAVYVVCGWKGDEGYMNRLYSRRHLEIRCTWWYIVYVQTLLMSLINDEKWFTSFFGGLSSRQQEEPDATNIDTVQRRQINDLPHLYPFTTYHIGCRVWEGYSLGPWVRVPVEARCMSAFTV